MEPMPTSQSMRFFTGASTLGDTDVRVNAGTGDIELTYTANAESTKVKVIATTIDV